MNARRLRLQNMIQEGHVPVVFDASVMNNNDESQIPFHWGDIEAIGYGFTSRKTDRWGGGSIKRTYTGPGKIKLIPITRNWEVVMEKNSEKKDVDWDML